MIIVRNNDPVTALFLENAPHTSFHLCEVQAAIDPDDPNGITIQNVINGLYEVFSLPYTEFADADGNPFANAEECKDYINGRACGMPEPRNGNLPAYTGSTDIYTDVYGFLDYTCTADYAGGWIFEDLPRRIGTANGDQRRLIGRIIGPSGTSQVTLTLTNAWGTTEVTLNLHKL